MSLTPAPSSPAAAPLQFDDDDVYESTTINHIQDNYYDQGAHGGPSHIDFGFDSTSFDQPSASSSSQSGPICSSWDIHDSMEDPENTPEEVLQTRRNIARNERRKSA
ncbi:hypothetical protein HDU99_002861, partial [Rhizoclosmatium hyalinum]